MTHTEQAQGNFKWLINNPYPGRGLVQGMDEGGKHMVQIYWIMGRSTGSRNRIFGVDGGRLFTEPADPTKIENRELTIYNAMAEKDATFFVVSNGHQTDTVVERAKEGLMLHNLLNGWTYEPDAPNYTPRITGLVHLKSWPKVKISQIWRGAEGIEDFRSQDISVFPGFGWGITTYSDDGNPLPSFTEHPLLLPLNGDQRTILDTYWNALNEKNRVSIAVKFIDRKGNSKIDIINRFQKI